MPTPIFQIQITLLDVKPTISRRLLVYPDITLIDFHRIIQTAMGWTNSHLHQFEKGNKFYAPREFEVEEANNSDNVMLDRILKNEGETIKYEYDFGDGWMHNIKLEKILPPDKSQEIPCCIDGKGKCPPEDCGGTHGYQRLKLVISNPEDEEFEEMMEWLGGEFDPDHFDLKEVNKLLKTPDYGCIWIH